MIDADDIMASMADEIQAMRSGYNANRLEASEEQREEDRRQRNLESCRKYREVHRERRRESDRRYRAKHHEEINARRRARAMERHATDPEYVKRRRASWHEYYAEHRDEINARRRARAQVRRKEQAQ